MSIWGRVSVQQIREGNVKSSGIAEFVLSIVTSALTLGALSTPFMARTASNTPALSGPGRYVLTDRDLVEKLKLEPLFAHAASGTVLVRVTDDQRAQLTRAAHDAHRCGGHELLTAIPEGTNLTDARHYARDVFKALDLQLFRDQAFRAATRGGIGLPPQPAPTRPPSMPDADIAQALFEVSEQNLRDTVALLARYPSRNHKSAEGQQAVLAFKAHIEETLKNATIPYTIELLSHQSTPMNSIRLTFKGLTNPDEVVVAGGHIDSINQSFFGSRLAPGADDNASGSANILEAARILSHGPAPAKTIEFYWYAGEEGGLLGSAEIAQSAKAAGKKIVGVLQLDMTLFPGDGEFTLGSMTDFTSQEMRDLLVTINRDYLGATIVEDKCGYGCSDHASWYRQGYPTLMPFEATMDHMNGNIHSERDVVSSSSNFRHSAMFSKIALAFLMSLSR